MSDDVKRDRWGRYLLPHPETGKEQSWTRATTVASTLADRYALEQWGNRNIVLGIAARQDLYALAVSCTPADRTQLNQIVKDAQEAARARSGANLGTALHRLTERVDLGDDLDIPPAWSSDIEAYVNALIDAQIRVHPEWVEQIVVNVDLNIAGTVDRLVTIHQQPDLYVADLKTGEGAVTYGANETALQLAIYANATHRWTGTDYQPMPTINLQTGLLIHLPVGKGECTIHKLDIAAGWEAVQLALQVRKWRKRDSLTEPLTTQKGARSDSQTVVLDDDW